MRLKCAADAESVFAGSVFVVRAAKSPSTRTTASSVSAVISAAISTEDNSAEVRHRNHTRNYITLWIKLFNRVLLSQGTAGASAGRASVNQNFVAERASALSARSLVFLRTNRFVRAEGTVTAAPVSATTTASKARLVNFALPAPASAPCTGTVIFQVAE